MRLLSPFLPSHRAHVLDIDMPQSGFHSIKSMEQNLWKSSSNFVGVISTLMYSINQFLTPPTLRWKPDPQVLFNVRFRGLDCHRVFGKRPSEPAVEGLLSLFLALWQLVTLFIPSMVYINMHKALVAAFPLLLIVYKIQPAKRADLGIFTFWLGLVIVIPDTVLMISQNVTEIRFAISNLPGSAFEVPKQYLPSLCRNLPTLAVIQISVILILGFYLTFRRTDEPELVKAKLWNDGTMWITSVKDHNRAVDSIWDIIPPPHDLSDLDREELRRNIMEFGKDKPVGYYGPKDPDATIAGFMMVVIALTNLFSANVPFHENQVLCASILVYILVGIIAMRIAIIKDRKAPEGAKVWMGIFGLWSFNYGVFLQKALNNFLGTL